MAAASQRRGGSERHPAEAVDGGPPEGEQLGAEGPREVPYNAGRIDHAESDPIGESDLGQPEEDCRRATRPGAHQRRAGGHQRAGGVAGGGSPARRGRRMGRAGTATRGARARPS